jgi:hypothetical protein
MLRILGAVSIAFGVVLAATAIALVSYLPGYTDASIKKAASINDPDSYKSFVRNDQADAVPKYFQYHHFNLTNPAEYLKGGKAILEEIGPFNLREYNVFIDAKIDNFWGTISYREWDHYVLEEDGSCPSCLKDAKITSFNAAYLNALTSLFNEEFTVCALAPNQTGITALESWAQDERRLMPHWRCGNADVYEQGKQALLAMSKLDGAWSTNGPALAEVPLGVAPVLLTRTFEEWAYGFPSTLAGNIISGLESDQVQTMREYGERVKGKYTHCAGLADPIMGESPGQQADEAVGKYLCFQVPGYVGTDNWLTQSDYEKYTPDYKIERQTVNCGTGSQSCLDYTTWENETKFSTYSTDCVDWPEIEKCLTNSSTRPSTEASVAECLALVAVKGRPITRTNGPSAFMVSAVTNQVLGALAQLPGLPPLPGLNLGCFPGKSSNEYKVVGNDGTQVRVELVNGNFFAFSVY